MNNEIIKNISISLNIKVWQVEVVLKLLEEGNTIPFIARYRKEKTGALTEDLIKEINEVYLYQVNLSKRKEDVIRLISEKGLMTDELNIEINSCTKLVEVEDIYRPYKEKKKTKATEAIKLGLEPLAKEIMLFDNRDIYFEAKKYLNDTIKTVELALTNASYIIAENISDNFRYRKWIRSYTYNYGELISKVKKNHNDVKEVYKIYYDFHSSLKYLKPHQILAINRGENEKVLTVNIDILDTIIIKYLEDNIILNKNCSSYLIVKNSIIDSYKRLIAPSIEREIRSDLMEYASDQAITSFMRNLESLLLTPPIKEKTVLALDPAYRTGCKLAVIDKMGKLLEIAVIYPVPPHNQVIEAKKVVIDLINKYQVDVIAIGNGTASRESESFIASTITELKRKVEYIIVNEAGASVYSASDNAINEFPSLTVEKRSAVSIGRRLQDALSELVKIEPKSIGVGLYQHDVNSTKLNDSLDFVVSKVVNQVGVNVNTSSYDLLKYVSGLNKKTITGIIDYRNKYGKINSRDEIKKIKGISDKVYEQSIGFIRILDGINPLDKTSIHPESYPKTLHLLNILGFTPSDIGTIELTKKLKEINCDDLINTLQIDKYTFDDIIKSLTSPNRDPRDMLPKPILKSDIVTINDLKKGMKLEGTIRNVVSFGVFIDIGLHNDGLAHISTLSNTFIKDPNDILKVGDIVTCYVKDIDLEHEKVSLSLIEGK